ncbi:hypothetical protein [Spirosoma telluris]
MQPTMNMPGAWAAYKDIPPSLSPISQNKTLYVGKFNDEMAQEPEAVEGLESVNDVLNYYKPEASVMLFDQEGAPATEVFEFRKMGDFTQEGLVEQSPLLRELSAQMRNLQKLDRHLRSNKLLQTALQNPQAKQIVLDMVQQMIDELEAAS